MKTRIFVTNSLNFLPRCDKIVFIQNGKIMGVGQYNELIKKSGAFSDFIGSNQVNIDQTDFDEPSLKFE